MKSQEYWANRALSNAVSSQKTADENLQEIIEAYNRLVKDINKDIRQIYYNFKEDTPDDVAKQILSTRESNEFLKELRETVDQIEDPDERKIAIRKINAPAYAYRISRLQALQEKIYMRCKVLASKQISETKKALEKVTQKEYLHTMYDSAVRSGEGIQISTDHLYEEILESIFKPEDFSPRVWKNTNTLAQKLNTVIKDGLARGKSYARMSADIKELTELGKYAADRVVRTECSKILNTSALKGIVDAGFDQYQYLAKLDIRTCEQCGALDEKIFNCSDAKVGVNLPPMHPNDRCTIVAYIEKYSNKGTRRAKDANGNYVKVPADMTYAEWKQKFVDNNPEAQKIIKKEKNKYSDKEQF